MNIDFKLLSENSLARNFSKSSLHPFMKPYVIRNKHDFSLNFKFTVKFLRNIINYIKESYKDREDFSILFVDANKYNSIEKLDNLPNNVFFTDKWLNGFLTNFHFTKFNLENNSEKKKNKLLDRKKYKYKDISIIKKKPNLVICSNMLYCFNVIKECKKSKIKVACITGPSSNPRLVDFPIIANDNNSNATNFIFNYIISNMNSTNDKGNETENQTDNASKETYGS